MSILTNHKSCKECPWGVKNNHNDMIVGFSKRTDKPHNCHMTDAGKKNLWDVKESTKCVGRKEYEKMLDGSK